MCDPLPRPLQTLAARRDPLASAAEQRRVLRALPVAHEVDDALATAGLRPLRATGIDVMQINVGRLCNQTCRHCHVDAGPDRREAMSRETMQHCLDGVESVDVSIDAKTVTVAGSFDDAAVRSAIDDAGYDVA